MTEAPVNSTQFQIGAPVIELSGRRDGVVERLQTGVSAAHRLKVQTLMKEVGAAGDRRPLRPTIAIAPSRGGGRNALGGGRYELLTQTRWTRFPEGSYVEAAKRV